MQFSGNIAPAKYQVWNGDFEILSHPDFNSDIKKQLQRYHRNCRNSSNSADGREAAQPEGGPVSTQRGFLHAGPSQTWGLSMEGLSTGWMRSPWDSSSPTCLGTKPLWKAVRSLTFLRHCLKTGGNKVREATRLLPQLGGSHCHGPGGWAAPRIFPPALCTLA